MSRAFPLARLNNRIERCRGISRNRDWQGKQYQQVARWTLLIGPDLGYHQCVAAPHHLGGGHSPSAQPAFTNAAITVREVTLAQAVRYSAEHLMTNTIVAFAVLVALFWVYIVAVSSRSREAGSALEGGRRS